MWLGKSDRLSHIVFLFLQEDDARSSGTSSPESTGSVETSISSHFGGMSYPSLFSSRPSGYGIPQHSVHAFKFWLFNHTGSFIKNTKQ